MSSSGSQIIESWISSFCNITGHEYFAEVSEDFVEDDFNLTGLSSQVGPRYKEALEMILDVEPDEDDLVDEEEEDEDEEDEVEIFDDDGQSLGFQKAERLADQRADRLNTNLSAIETSAELLYGLIHQRYITSRPGIGQMHEKYELGHFGVCPRVHCNGCRVLPVGLSDQPGRETVKLFCPSCMDVYTPPNSRFQAVDGAFFGTTFGCLFFMTYPELQIDQTRRHDTITASSDVGSDDEGLEDEHSVKYATSHQRAAAVLSQSTTPQPAEINGVPTANLAPGLGKGNIYEPKVYGFKVSETSRAGPRMKWLRMKPADVNELDEVAQYEGDSTADAEEGVDSTGKQGETAQAAAAAQQQQVDRRKKAPIRRRRRTVDDAGPPKGANGVNGVG